MKRRAWSVCVKERKSKTRARLTSQAGSAEIWAIEVAARALRAVATRNFILHVVLSVECWCGVLD